MTGERDLATLLATMEPEQRPGEFVFVTAPPGTIDRDDAHATVREPEGLTYVVTRDHADVLGLPYEYVAGWITLTVHSALEAVGLTAAVAARLAERDISCNVIAGYYHDHLLVPADRVADALAALQSPGNRAASP